MTKPIGYRVTSRYLVKGKGWHTESTDHLGLTFQQAGRRASVEAHRLDVLYGDDHAWTVDLYGLRDGEETDDLGSYYQLFHGRLE
jgi:hypothetical protein